MHDPAPSSDEKPLREGSRGAEVRDLQNFLNKLGAHLTVDGIFGPATEQAVRHFQTAHHLASDGIVGPMTWTALDTALVSAHPAPTPPSDGKLLREGSQGADVRDLQSWLDKLGAHLTVDGVFGPATEKAVRQFQAAHHLGSDGIVGPQTWAALGNALASAHPAPSSQHWSAENDHVVWEMISAALHRHGNDPKFAYLDVSAQRQQPQNFYDTNMAYAGDFLRAAYDTKVYGPEFALAEIKVYMDAKKHHIDLIARPEGPGPVSPYSEKELAFMNAGVADEVGKMSTWELGLHALAPQYDIAHRVLAYGHALFS